MNAYVICALVFCLPIAFAALSADVDITLHNYEDECVKEAGITLEPVEVARKQHKMPESGEMDQFSICMLKKFNVLNQDGSVNQNVRSYKIFTDSLYIYELSETCKVLEGKDAGETARKIMNCYFGGNEIVLGLTRNKNSP